MEIKVGDRVEGGYGDDHDVGTIGYPESGDALDELGDRDAPIDEVWVRWDSGVSTWTPIEHLSHV